MGFRLGIDIGSTTIKIAIIDKANKLVFSKYQRHFSNIKETLALMVQEAKNELGNIKTKAMITGSGGLSLAKNVGVKFIQEVVSVSTAIERFSPKTDVAIEIGGEDAKIIYLKNGLEQRMNGICAGGTGSFIDQMAALLQTDAMGLNEYAKNYKTIYPIAARCGVFAKSDIQPLINEGAAKEDLAVSIFQAIVNQTISGLACGKPIRGNVCFLGGPLHFLSELRSRFVDVLGLTDETAIIPENSHLFAALG
ncbi:MAG: 2-hydroxyglutaryl-CoA dehydratase, partial [Defluviitaleaceae bacterium]|nr:2-hydroxyglutaryl-CoA dehydratase [Defluviitaleaceae bacterium]